MDPTHALNAPPQTPQHPESSPSPTGASPAPAAHHSLVAATGEQCPSCGNPVASDQRYCLNCGQRCGDPRLPFMNAVTFMEAMKRPAAASPPPPPKRRRLSPNAALIASVGTLLLAMGVGVLIGRSGNDTAAVPQQQAPIVIKGGGGAEGATAAGGAATAAGKSSKPSKKAAAKAKAAAESGEGAEKVLKPAAGVDLPPATVQPGGKCKGDQAGCQGGEFTGEFFGE